MKLRYPPQTSSPSLHTRKHAISPVRRRPFPRVSFPSLRVSKLPLPSHHPIQATHGPQNISEEQMPSKGAELLEWPMVLEYHLSLHTSLAGLQRQRTRIYQPSAQLHHPCPRKRIHRLRGHYGVCDRHRHRLQRPSPVPAAQDQHPPRGTRGGRGKLFLRRSRHWPNLACPKA